MIKQTKATSVAVDPELWRQFKMYCVQNNISIREYFENHIKQLLSTASKKFR